MFKDTLDIDVKKAPEYHSVGIKQEDVVRLVTEVNNLTQMKPFKFDEVSPFEFPGSVKGRGSPRYQRRQREYVVMNLQIREIPDSPYVLPPEKIREVQLLWDAIRMAPGLKGLGVFLEDWWEVSGYLTKDNKVARKVSLMFTYYPKEAKKHDDWLKQQIVEFEGKLAKSDMEPEERKRARVEFAKMMGLKGV